MLRSGGELVLSDTNPSLSARTSYWTPSGISLTDQFLPYAAVYRSQVWVYTVVNKLATGTARLPLKVYERVGEGRQEARDDAFARLLRNPNPRHDAKFFWLWTASTFFVYGEALWLKIRPAPDRPPMELWPLHPANVDARTEDGELFYYFGHSARLRIPARDVVHFKTYNPDSTTRGLSPIEPLRQTILNEDSSRRASSAFWRNSARPSVALKHKGKLSPEAAARLAANWNGIHAGVDNHAKTAILEEGMEPEVISLSAEEAQYVETQKLTREETCAAYDTSPLVVHILDRATFSNVTEQLRSHYRDTMAPKLDGFESTLDAQLRPDFHAADTHYAEFLMDEVLRGTFEERAEQVQSAINSGQLTPNEGRRLDNRKPLPGGDRLYINSALVPIENAGTRPPTTPPAPAKSLTQAEAKTVTDRLARRSSLAEVDVKALTAGLNGKAEVVADALAESLTVGDSPAALCVRVWSLVKEDS